MSHRFIFSRSMNLLEMFQQSVDGSCLMTWVIGQRIIEIHDFI